MYTTIINLNYNFRPQIQFTLKGEMSMKIKKLIKTAALTIAALTMVISFSPATNSNPVASRFSPVISAQAKTAPHLNYTKLFLQCGQKKRLKVKGYRGKVRFSSGSKFI